MKVTVGIDFEQLLRENKTDLLSWALGDSDFVDSFISLIVDGASLGGDWPAHCDALRLKMLEKLIGAEFAADMMRETQAAEAQRNEYRTTAWNLQRRLETAQRLLPKFRAKLEEVGHGENRDTCETCEFLRAISEEPFKAGE